MLQAVDLTIRLHAEDDVVIARMELATGTLVSKENVRTVVSKTAGAVASEVRVDAVPLVYARSASPVLLIR